MLLVLSMIALIGAAVIGGVFLAFSNFVMSALRLLPPAQGLAAMQSINVTVLNPGFLGAFVGTAVVSVVAIVFACLDWSDPAAIYSLAGGVLYVGGCFLVTGLGNVPLNNALVPVDPADEDAAERWRRYDARWTRLNHVRTAACLLAAAAFGLGLFQG